MAWFGSNRYGPEQIWLTQVVFCGMVEAAQKALRATHVCTEIYMTAEITGPQPTDAPNAPSKRTFAINCTSFVHILA